MEEFSESPRIIGFAKEKNIYKSLLTSTMPVKVGKCMVLDVLVLNGHRVMPPINVVFFWTCFSIGNVSIYPTLPKTFT